MCDCKDDDYCADCDYIATLKELRASMYEYERDLNIAIIIDDDRSKEPVLEKVKEWIEDIEQVLDD